MLYKKINVELIVVADEADAVVAELNVAFDQMEERHTAFRWWHRNCRFRALGNSEEIGTRAYARRRRGCRCCSQGYTWERGCGHPCRHLM